MVVKVVHFSKMFMCHVGQTARETVGMWISKVTPFQGNLFLFKTLFNLISLRIPHFWIVSISKCRLVFVSSLPFYVVCCFSCYSIAGYIIWCHKFSIALILSTMSMFLLLFWCSGFLLQSLLFILELLQDFFYYKQIEILIIIIGEYSEFMSNILKMPLL